jgi:GDP-L-fucose synthase
LEYLESPGAELEPYISKPLESYSGKKILIAGGTGMIGRPLCSLLRDLGAVVTVAGLEAPAEAREMLPKETSYLQADFTDLDAAREACAGQDFVFNLVGIKGSVGIGETKAASYLLPMLRFQANLTEAAWEAGVKGFLFVSSINIYPQAALHLETNAWKGAPLQNDRIPGVGKRVGEVLGLAFQLEHGWDAMKVVRPANVYGRYDVIDPLRSQVIPALIHKFLREKKRVSVWGDGSAVRDFVFSDDIAFWFAKAMLSLPPNYPVNLGSGSGITIEELAQTVATVTGFSGHIEFDVSKPSGDPIRLLDITRARRLMAYENLTPLEEGIAKTMDWMRLQV